MTKHYSIKGTLFSTWLDLYKSVEKEGQTDGELCVFCDVDDVVICEMELRYIKAQAFDEVYKRLPGEGVAQVVKELLEGPMSLTERGQALKFLNKIPTRQIL